MITSTDLRRLSLILGIVCVSLATVAVVAMDSADRLIVPAIGDSAFAKHDVIGGDAGQPETNVPPPASIDDPAEWLNSTNISAGGSVISGLAAFLTFLVSFFRGKREVITLVPTITDLSTISAALKQPKPRTRRRSRSTT